MSHILKWVSDNTVKDKLLIAYVIVFFSIRTLKTKLTKQYGSAFEGKYWSFSQLITQSLRL